MICSGCGRRVDPKDPCRCKHPRPADPAGAYATALRNLADNAGAVPIRLSGVEIAILREAATELGQLAEARATITRLNRRCQIAEAAANMKVEDAEKRSKRGIRRYLFELGRMDGAEQVIKVLQRFRVEGPDPNCWCGFNVGMGPHDEDCLAAKALIATAGIVSAEVTDATVEDPTGTGAREPGARAAESSDREERGDPRQSGTDRQKPVGEGGAARGEEAAAAGQAADPQDLVRRAIAICDRHDTWIADQIRDALGIAG